ncbi:hypothetical protein FDF99_14925 [Clostridium botulinum]|nr:hypothetical protein [Clostridium botulinum]NFG74519.1 hypothetical protein [Clostridium botulinum]NFI31887.1 hypothetical protein [Clostridium botulinum]NFQ96833.1 hypothetical protein [Clostridium botulinum]
MVNYNIVLKDNSKNCEFNPKINISGFKLSFKEYNFIIYKLRRRNIAYPLFINMGSANISDKTHSKEYFPLMWVLLIINSYIML